MRQGWRQGVPCVVALVIAETAALSLLTVLVAGLLRSHADILRSLHELGVGVGDPASGPSDRSATAGLPVPFSAAPPEGQVHDIIGIGLAGEAVGLAMTGRSGYTLLAFLSTGCASCIPFWHGLSDPGRGGLPPSVAPLVVTRGPDVESAAEAARLAPAGTSVVMSGTAWSEYAVPGSPFFVLVDGLEGRRVGEGVARTFPQLADLVRRGLADAKGRRDEAGPSGRNRLAGGAERETENDLTLVRAGVAPGDPSLYPKRLDDLMSPVPVDGEGWRR